MNLTTTILRVCTLVLCFNLLGCKQRDSHVEPLVGNHSKDAGEVWVNWEDPTSIPKIQAAFTVQNTKDRAVHLVLEHLSCSCLHVVTPDSIGPGESVDILLSYEPRQKAERRLESVTFRTGDVDSEKAKFELQSVTVPNGIILPYKYFQSTVEAVSNFELEFEYVCYFKKGSPLDNLEITAIHSDDFEAIVHHDKIQSGTYRDFLGYLRVPITLKASEQLALPIGARRSFQFGARNTQSNQAVANLVLTRTGSYQTTPQQVFLDRSKSDAEKNIEIKFFRDKQKLCGEVSQVQLNQSVLKPPFWSIDSKKSNGFSVHLDLEEIQRILTNNQGQTQVQNELVFTVGEEAVSVPLVQF